MDYLENLKERIVFGNEEAYINNRFENNCYALILPDGAIRGFTLNNYNFSGGNYDFSVGFQLWLYNLEYKKCRIEKRGFSTVHKYEVVEIDPVEKVAWLELVKEIK